MKALMAPTAFYVLDLPNSKPGGPAEKGFKGKATAPLSPAS